MFFRLMNVFRKVHEATAILKYFQLTEILIHNGNVRKMNNDMNIYDREIYFYNDVSKIDWMNVLFRYLRGGLFYLLQETDKSVDYYKKIIFRKNLFKYVHYFLVSLILYGLYKICDRITAAYNA